MAAAASSRPFLLAASLYGVTGLPHGHLSPSSNASVGTNLSGTPGQTSFSALPSFAVNESVTSINSSLDQRRSSNSAISAGNSPLDLSHLAATVGSSAAAAAGVRAAAAAAVHPFLQLHRGTPGKYKHMNFEFFISTLSSVKKDFMYLLNIGLFTGFPSSQAPQTTNGGNNNNLKEGFRGLSSSETKLYHSAR